MSPAVTVAAVAALSAVAAGGSLATDPAIIVAVLAALAAIAGGLFSYKSSRAANATAARTVSQDEFDRQAARYRDMLAEQDKHIDRIRSQLDRVQDQLAREQDVSNALRNEIRALQGQVDALAALRPGHPNIPIRPPGLVP